MVDREAFFYSSFRDERSIGGWGGEGLQGQGCKETPACSLRWGRGPAYPCSPLLSALLTSGLRSQPPDILRQKLCRGNSLPYTSLRASHLIFRFQFKRQMQGPLCKKQERSAVKSTKYKAFPSVPWSRLVMMFLICYLMSS